MQIDVKRKITADEYEKLPEGPPQQLIEGEIIMSPSPTPVHQLLVVELTTILKNYITKNRLGFVFVAPIDVFFKENEIYQPDIIFISSENKAIIQEKIKGIPDLIIEILSPSTAYYDLVHKKNIYEETGVKEFWTVDAEGKGIEIYQNIDGKFMLFSKARSSGSVTSKLFPDFKIEIEKLFSVL